MIDYSVSRKQAQKDGTLPDWYTTGGFQLINEKEYISKEETVRDRYSTIATTLSEHMPEELKEEYNKIFFDLLWDGYLSPSTPVFSNIGTNKGMPIACSGSYVLDSVDSFYKVSHEIAMLSKEGFGTSVYLGSIRPRGSLISTGGKADGIVPVMELLFNTTSHVSQGSNRRGSIACYIPVDHGDFWECVHFIENNPDHTNIGWLLSDKSLSLIKNKDEEMSKRYAKVLYLRMQGTGYLHFTDKADRLSPQVYKDNKLKISASNLCSEIYLHSSEEYTYTCCLSSINLTKWDEIVERDYIDVFNSIIFLDCVNSEFIKRSKGKKGLKKARAFAEWSRPVGLGVMGLGTYFQSKGIQFDGLDGQFTNQAIFKKLSEVTHEANKYLGTLMGESPLMKGTGLRMSHTQAIAPTMSTALIMGGVSNGIEPYFANIFTQVSAGGEIRRANPILVSLMKKKGIWNKSYIDRIIEDEGSIQNIEEFSPEEKLVLRTAFECDQGALARMNDQRSKYVDQGISFNLFILASSSEERISELHQQIINSKYIKGVYYVRSSAGINARTQLTESTCSSCEG